MGGLLGGCEILLRALPPTKISSSKVLKHSGSGLLCLFKAKHNKQALAVAKNSIQALAST
jgi:hypothetical protein